MANLLWNAQWNNQNSQRNYPFADNASLTDQTGAFTLPDDFIIWLGLPVNTGMAVDPGQFFLMSLTAYGTGYLITVGYQPAAGGLPYPVATASITATTAKNQGYVLGGVGNFTDTIGRVVIGNLNSIVLQPAGVWTFNFAATRLNPDSIRPIIQDVTSLTCMNGDQTTVTLQGDITLSAGRNCLLTPTLVSEYSSVIRIDFIQGAGSVASCTCEGNTVATMPITSFNGVTPTPGGSFSIVGSSCVQVVPIANGIQLVDSCSQPCCGCTELEAVTKALAQLGQEAASVNIFVNQLNSAVQIMDSTVLGARLSDQSCLSCT